MKCMEIINLSLEYEAKIKDLQQGLKQLRNYGDNYLESIEQDKRMSVQLLHSNLMSITRKYAAFCDTDYNVAPIFPKVKEDDVF